jgi:hypothetical protein
MLRSFIEYEFPEFVKIQFAVWMAVFVVQIVLVLEHREKKKEIHRQQSL